MNDLTLNHAALPAGPLAHGGRLLPAVTVDTYNEELRDEEGFVGDRASRRAFRAILADWRERLKENDADPFGDTPTEELSKAKLDKIMGSDDPVAAALVHTVVEEFAGELATVVRRFMRLESWKGTERIVLGGGLIASRIGELSMGRASILLRAAGVDVELCSIKRPPGSWPATTRSWRPISAAPTCGSVSSSSGLASTAMWPRPMSGSASTGGTSTTSRPGTRRLTGSAGCSPS